MAELVTPHVTVDTNFKEFFLKHDGINNIADQLIFSILGKYRCNAGCNMCYLKPFWIPASEFDQYVPIINDDDEAKLLEFFDWFEVASTHDDLYSLRKQNPVLFAFYERNSNRMWYAGMTDISLIQQQPIIEQLNFRGVYEVSISEKFISHGDGKVFNTVIERMERLIDQTALTKMKVIIETPNGEHNKYINGLIEWAHKHGIPVGQHNDFSNIGMVNSTQGQADYTEGYQAVNSTPVMILSESIHGQLGDLYMTLADATMASGNPFYNILSDGLSPSSVMLAMLKAKIVRYAANAKILTLPNGKPMRDYCKYVASNVQVNDDFTFIPTFLLGPWTKIYKYMASHGFSSTQYGLIKTGATKVVPIISFKDNI